MRTRVLVRLVVLLAVLPIMTAGSVYGQARLGTVAFLNSGQPDAQPAFLRGVAALHSFWYEEAADAFREAQRIDPAFALAYWGEAMTYNHPIWLEVDAEAGRAALARYKGEAPTARERAYLEAVAILFGNAGKRAQDLRYEEAMSRLATAHPEDREARAFHALSILGTMQPGEADARKQVRAAAILEPLIPTLPDHPGVLHYMIHAYDDPVHAPLGLRAARRYARVAPAAHHALHMPSHIFLQLGMWDEAAKSNEEAYAASKAWIARANLKSDKRDLHSLSWLQYVYLQQGRFDDAGKLLAEAAGETSRERSTRQRMQARQAVESGDWSVIGSEEITPSTEHRCGVTPMRHGGSEAVLFARAMRAIAATDRENTGKQLSALDEMRSTEKRPEQVRTIETMQREIEALLALEEKRVPDALRLLGEAVHLEETLGAPSGPPDVLKPAHELLGEILLRTGDPAAALEHFRASLLRTPNRRLSLEGAARAAEKLGDADSAREYRLALPHRAAVAKP